MDPLPLAVAQSMEKADPLEDLVTVKFRVVVPEFPSRMATSLMLMMSPRETSPAQALLASNGPVAMRQAKDFRASRGRDRK